MKIKTLVAMLFLSAGATTVVAQDATNCNSNSSISHEAVRAGAIIPFGDDIQYTDEKPAEHIRLYIYQGADGKFTLYEDEGVNYNYEQGMYAMIPMKYDEATKTLVIGERQGEFPGMLKERTFTVVTVNKEKAQPFDLNAKGVTVKYNGSEQTLKL